LVNDLDFNLCVVLWSPVVRLVMYFGVEESCQKGVLIKWNRNRVDRDSIRTR